MYIILDEGTPPKWLKFTEQPPQANKDYRTDNQNQNRKTGQRPQRNGSSGPG
jgi:hypothetical protein